MDAGRGLNGAVYCDVAASCFFFVEGADEGHLDVGGVPGSTYDIEGAFAHGFKVELPLANASSDNDAGNSVLTMIGVDQIGVTAIGQVLVAKNHFKTLVGKDFLGLSSAGTGDHVGSQRLKYVKQSFTQLQPWRNEQGANVALQCGNVRFLAK
jgi:hypothetical protein